MKTLFVIPARGGSKGIPGKNTKLLSGKPLIEYSIDTARQFTTDDHICVTTDDPLIAEVVTRYGLKIPFYRPASLATDDARIYDVLVHVLKYYDFNGQNYDAILLLQPTSPFRTPEHIEGIRSLFSKDIDRVVSVTESMANPYYILMEEDENGYLHTSKTVPGKEIRSRQAAPKVYQLNGSLFMINPDSLRKYNSYAEFKKTIKYEMEAAYSIDIDTVLDWEFCEFLLQNRIVIPNLSPKKRAA